MRTIFAAMLVAASAIAQPVSTKVQDLSDAKISSNKTPGYVLTQATNASGGRYWTNLPSSGGGGGAITNSAAGGGTVNTLPKWTSTNALGDSQVIEYGLGASYDYVLSLGTNDAFYQIAIQPRTNTTATASVLYVKGGASSEAGGDVLIQGGDGLANNGYGGSVSISGGSPVGTGNGGAVSITSLRNFSINAGAFDTEITSAAVRPAGNNSMSLGTASFEWGSNYIGTKLFLGTNQYTDNGTNLLRNGVAVGGGSGGITNSGLTLNTIVKATGTNGVGNSSFTDNGTAVTMTEPLLFSPDNTVDIGASNATRARNIYAGTTFYAPDGTTARPSYAFASATNSGFLSSSGAILVAVSGVNRLQLTSSLVDVGPRVAFGNIIGNQSTEINLDNTAALQMGLDAASPTAQTFKHADARAGTDTNARGGDMTVAGGRGTGTNYGGTLYFATTTPGTSGTGGGILTNRAGIDGTNGAFFVVNLNPGAATLPLGVTSGGQLTTNGVTAGDSTATNVVTLTYSGGTNISQLDFALVQAGGVFKLALTNNGYIGVPANVATSPFRKGWLIVQNSGGFILQFTNGNWAWPEGVSPVVDTNAGSVSYFQFISDVFTNSLLHGTMVPLSKLATNM